MKEFQRYSIQKVEDPFFNRVLLGRITNLMVIGGKKHKSYKQLCFLLSEIKKKYKKNPCMVFLRFGLFLSFGVMIRRKKVRKIIYDIPSPVPKVNIMFNNAFKLYFVASYFYRKEKISLKKKMFLEFQDNYEYLFQGKTIQALKLILRDVKRNKNYKSFKWG